MERVLYEYTFNFENILFSFIPLAIGIVFFANSIKQVRQKSKNKGWDKLFDSFFKYIGFIVGPLCILMFFIMTIEMSLEHKDYIKMLESNQIHVVEGYVEEYHPMPYEGHDTEHFKINGVYFEYSDYTVMNGYNISASHGGVISHNGQHLKIKYIENEFDGEIENIILYIAEIGDDVTNNIGL